MRRLIVLMLVIFFIVVCTWTISRSDELIPTIESESTIYETHYILDTGNIHMWANSNGIWIEDDNGQFPKPHTWYDNPNQVKIKLAEGAIVDQVYPYDGTNFLTKGSGFTFTLL